ncbi:cytochrome c oxidase subunit II [Thermocoleostomius sinensis]|uniref:Cytochrome c oxidase subunit 2 n=1 Tax=Thermocoleostomius sinensis A174 TaxID=2016057 RepID=A0A9E8Z7R9_9CYAN|nr:cytochrome c oxidase subunit II [Thermocoleostomius sinensis]WAL58030.1 cytochrome c oxidase subunit II [Thermocoleostomius sinensis A174]
MKQIPISLLTLVAGVVITLISIWVGQNHGLLPEQASEQAPLVDNLFNTMMIIATALFLVVEGALVAFMIMFRKREGDETDGEPIEGNLPLEAFWTAIPAIIVIGLGVYSVAVFQEMGGLNPGDHAVMAHGSPSTLVAQMPEGEPIAGDVMPLMAESEGTSSDEVRPYYGFGSPDQDQIKPADLVVNVTGMQYAWLFNYPGDNITTGELHVPVGRDVQLNLSAQDVIHSFWVPQFRLKQDAIPGLKTELRFVATKPGTYPVVCTELCGAYHGGMRSQVVVHPQEEFDQWLDENRVVAEQPVDSTVATNPADMSAIEFLAPVSQAMGIPTDALTHLHVAHDS